MVTLSHVQSSNSLISSTLPPNLVAVFTGATSGIGEATLKQFAKSTRQPRAYFIGRSQDAGDRIAAECKALNPEGEFEFIKADVSLMRVVDEVCEEIKTKEKAINILFLSAGVAVLDRRETSEHLHLLTALAYYSRYRFITNLLPLLRRAPTLRRVVTIAKGGFEGRIDPSDFPAIRVPLTAIRGHLCTLITLGLESLARTAPEVSFVHADPGAVKTALFDHVEGMIGFFMRAFMFLVGYWVCVPIEECGERQLYLATSARYPPASSDGADHGSGIPLGDGVGVARGTTGDVGSGVYSVGWDGTSASPAVEKLLADYRDKEMVEVIRRHTKTPLEQTWLATQLPGQGWEQSDCRVSSREGTSEIGQPPILQKRSREPRYSRQSSNPFFSFERSDMESIHGPSIEQKSTSMQADDPYRSIYEQIPVNDSRTRVLVLHSHPSNVALVSCWLEVMTLEPEPSWAYTALSYVWGDASVTEDIVVNGVSFTVTSNLALALRQIRKSFGEVVLWTDAISRVLLEFHKTSDHPDHVHGLDIVPDYGDDVTIADVSLEVAQHCLKAQSVKTEPLDILSRAGTRQSCSGPDCLTHLDLPSCVPDWRFPPPARVRLHRYLQSHAFPSNGGLRMQVIDQKWIQGSGVLWGTVSTTECKTGWDLTEWDLAGKSDSEKLGDRTYQSGNFTLQSHDYSLAWRI